MRRTPCDDVSIIKDYDSVIPPSGSAFVEKLKENLKNNKVEYYHIKSLDEALNTISQIVSEEKSVFVYDYLDVWYLNLSRIIKSVAPSREEFRNLKIAIVSGHLAFVDSGTILFFSDYFLSSLLTVPETLVILLGIERIYRSIRDSIDYIRSIWKGMFKGNVNINLFSTPSRTGDIEKKIVMGAHGPKRVIVLILDWYEDLLNMEYPLWAPHYRLLPFACRDFEERIRRENGTLSIFDVLLASRVGYDISGFLDTLLDFYRDVLGLDLSGVIKG